MRILLSVMLFFVVTFGYSQTLDGVVSDVIDADTFVLGDQRIRLCGIDAPESGSKGRLGHLFLSDLLRSASLSCRVVGSGTPCDGRSRSSSYNRLVAQCFLDGADIAKILVRSGYAVDVPRYSGGYYGKLN